MPGLVPSSACSTRCPRSLSQRAATWLSLSFRSPKTMAWAGHATDWNHFEKAYLLLAGLATGLVLSVHSVVSFDFAVSLVPGWHMTIFPPYFVTGAIFAGFAMVVLVMVPVRRIMGIENLITMAHLDVMNKVILAMSCLMGYSYFMEGFTAWYSMNPFIHWTFTQYVAGQYGWAGCLTIACNVVIPQLLWVPRFRRSFVVMTLVAIGITIGMWFERFVIILMSLQNDYLPSAWGFYVPTLVDLGILASTFGLFFSLVLLFAKALPVIATTEMKADLPGAQPTHHGAQHG